MSIDVQLPDSAIDWVAVHNGTKNAVSTATGVHGDPLNQLLASIPQPVTEFPVVDGITLTWYPPVDMREWVL
jgi:hypothetical protein